MSNSKIPLPKFLPKIASKTLGVQILIEFDVIVQEICTKFHKIWTISSHLSLQYKLRVSALALNQWHLTRFPTWLMSD